MKKYLGALAVATTFSAPVFADLPPIFTIKRVVTDGSGCPRNKVKVKKGQQSGSSTTRGQFSIDFLDQFVVEGDDMESSEKDCSVIAEIEFTDKKNRYQLRVTDFKAVFNSQLTRGSGAMIFSVGYFGKADSQYVDHFNSHQRGRRVLSGALENKVWSPCGKTLTVDLQTNINLLADSRGSVAMLRQSGEMIALGFATKKC